MNSDDLRSRDRASIWHPYTRHSGLGQDFPIIERGDGPYLYDIDGRQYFDAISSWWCCGLGHSHPGIVDAIQSQAQTLQHSILGNLSHHRAIELAERIAALFPSRPRRVFYGSDGASAVEAALKIAVQYWDNAGHSERHRFVSLSGAYHGDTLGAVSVGFMETFHHSFAPVVFDTYTASQPCEGIHGYGLLEHSCDADCLGSIPSLIEEHAAELAAVIVEPLCQGAAGMVMYGPGYLTHLAECCARHDVLLIVDEIATGFGRTGRMFAHEHAGIDPDIICVGKALSGGALPISAAIVTDAIYASFSDEDRDRTFYHGHTFGGNPIACAAALAALDAYAELAPPAAGESPWTGIEHNAAILAASLRDLLDLPGIKDARCLGMIAAVEFNSPPAQMHAELLDHGILLRPLGNVIYLLPPLNVELGILEPVAVAFVEAAKAEADRQRN